MPPEQVAIAQRGAIAGTDSSNVKQGKPQSPPASVDKAGHILDSGITKEVALKMIPKKKVKGNEASVWGEMEVLKGLDHPNIVRPASVGPRWQ